MNNNRQTVKIPLHVSAWHALVPGVDTVDDWQAWINNKWQTPAKLPSLDVSFFPAMLRRRLDHLGRMSVASMWPCVGALDGAGFVHVFGSRHGSLERTKTILADLAEDSPVSPTAFSMSVHNAISGLISMACKNHAAATAMAAGADTLLMTLLEAGLLQMQNNTPVVMTFAEDTIPEVYQPLLPNMSRVYPFALSLLLDRSKPCSFNLYQRDTGTVSGMADEHALVDFLRHDRAQVALGRDTHWLLERVHG